MFTLRVQGNVILCVNDKLCPSNDSVILGSINFVHRYWKLMTAVYEHIKWEGRYS